MKTSTLWLAPLATSLLLALACGDDLSGNVVDNEGNNPANNDPANNDPANNDPANNDPANNDPANNGESCTEVTLPDEPRAVGLVYTDSDQSDVSTYVGGFEGGRDAPIGGLEVSLFGPGLEETVSTCMDGRAAFGPLEDGAYLLVPDFPEGDCMTKNCVRRLPEAIRAGGVKIVTFGDSVPVIGDAPMFPSRLATLLGDITDVNNTNIAIGGTTSHNWLPGTPNFENTLIPQISDADVIMVSLGGNDLLAFIQANAANLGNIAALVEDVKAEVNAILSRLITIVDAIREQNNTADIVYLLYPDYSRADMDMMWALVNQFVGAETVREVLETARDSLDASEDVILVDVFGSTQGTDVNTILADSLHFNDIGQTLYAEEIFKTLGGVLVGPSPLGGQPRTPLGTDQQFSLAP